jgi:hypothetical protein
MKRSAQRRGGPLSSLSRNQRIAAAAAILVVFGALLTVSRVSSAEERRASAEPTCGPVVPGATAPNGQDTVTTTQNGRQVRNHWGDGQRQAAACEPSNVQVAAAAKTANCPSVADKLPKVPDAVKAEVDQDLAQLKVQVDDTNRKLAAVKGQTNNEKEVMSQLAAQRTATINRITDALTRAGAKPQDLKSLATCTLAAGKDSGGNTGGNNTGGKNNNNGGKLNILADKCGDGGSKLTLHDGFQKPNRCVDTEMGEVGSAAKNPSLLITDFPNQVKPNQAFQIRVSTRNLIRDRFLAAAQGGYYVEMSKLNAQGLVRGHFHTACRMLDGTDSAPDPAPVPAFFVATEDNGGSAKPDEIVINVPGLPERGTAQCSSWAGDGSHRIPMMERANQTPAFDAVRITVK